MLLILFPLRIIYFISRQKWW